MRTELERHGASFVSDDHIEQMQELVRRIRDFGEEIDEAAIEAITEATGAPVEYVRLAVRSEPQQEKQNPFSRLRNSFLAFSPTARRYVGAGVLGLLTGLLAAVGWTYDVSGFSGTLMTVGILVGAWNATVSRTKDVGALSGGLFTSSTYLTMSLFLLLFRMLPIPFIQVPTSSPIMLAVWTAIGMVGGLALCAIGGAFRERSGARDPSVKRQQLLHQLLDIQDRLKSDERIVTFLSLDIVGSTKIKRGQDPLSVEFTFNEYHRYIESVVIKHGGRVHSTAGDGVTCVFDHPHQAFMAGKSALSGLFEFNAFRNRLEAAIELRGGIHTGSVLAPGQDPTSVNFASVIDLAAHLQKVAPVGCLGVSEQSASYFPDGAAQFEPEPLAADDLTARVWRPRSTVSLPKAGVSGAAPQA